MTEVYFLISLIVLTDIVILYFIYHFDRPNKFDKELKPDLIIGLDNWDLLALPLIFVIPFVWLQGVLQTINNWYLLPFMIICILTIVSLFLVLRYRFNRYYLNNNGIVILNLFTNQILKISIEKIQGYIFHKGVRSPGRYIVVTEGKKIKLSVRQIKNIKVFKDYFKKHEIQFYEHDWITGIDDKK